MTGGLPGPDEPLGSLDFRVRWALPTSDEPFVAAGRGACVTGRGSGPIGAVWTGDIRALRDLRTDGTVRRVEETPLGVERHCDVGGRRIVERVVVHPDAPVAWIEWAPDPEGESAGNDAPTLSLEWRVGLDVPGLEAAGEAAVRGDASKAHRPPDWERTSRGVVATRSDPRFRAHFVFSAAPDALAVDAVGDELVVRARVRVPESGVRMAIVGAGPNDDTDRLLRMAGRSRAAVRGREGAANRLLDDGLTVVTPDAALNNAMRRAQLRLHAAGLPAPPGPWRTEEAMRTAWAHLLVGDFAAVRTFLGRLGRLARDGRGRMPSRVLGDRPVAWGDERDGLGFLLLAGRYLAWSGDTSGVRALWPFVESVATVGGAEDELPADQDEGRTDGGELRTDGALRDAALDAVRLMAEAIGEAGPAGRSGGRGGSEPRGPESAAAGVWGWPGAGSGLAIPEAAAPSGLQVDPSDPVSTVTRVLGGLLAPEPDASRGRLEIRPRALESWDRFEVRRLAVGPSAVDVVYEREGTRHRFEVSQTRGPTPVTLVLAPELRGENVVAVRVDRKPADLDVESAGGRCRVPVQLVLDHPRTLEVEIAPGTP